MPGDLVELPAKLEREARPLRRPAAARPEKARKARRGAYFNPSSISSAAFTSRGPESGWKMQLAAS
jgi:hypothetical protein